MPIRGNIPCHHYRTVALHALFISYILFIGIGMPAAPPAHYLAPGEGSDREQLHEHSRHGEHFIAEHRMGQHPQVGRQGARGAPTGSGQPVSTVVPEFEFVCVSFITTRWIADAW